MPTPSRAQVLASLAALATTSLLGASPAPGPVSARDLIDVHHHFYPPEFRAASNAWSAKRGQPPLGGPIGAWTAQRSIDEMDANGIRTAMLSLASINGVWFEQPPRAWASLARHCNDYAAGMMRDYPGRFGLFATLPLPDVDASLAEIAYAFDTLHADGIGIPTSWGDTWPGDARFAPIWTELNWRKAIVVFHPLAPTCCSGTLVPNTAESYLEYPYDTGRAFESLLFSGTLRAYRDVRWTFCHAGGPIPVFANRIQTLAQFQQKNLPDVAPDGILAEVQRCYFDTANANYAPSMAALLALIPPSQIMFGTDYPYVSGKINVSNLLARALPSATYAAIARDNAKRLVPRLA